MTRCPQCHTATERETIGHGDQQREVAICFACWTVWPLRHLVALRERRDLA